MSSKEALFQFSLTARKTERKPLTLSTLISLINVNSRLPILKNSTLHKKIPPPQNCFLLNYTKTVLFKLELSCKSNMFYPTSYLLKYKRRGL